MEDYEFLSPLHRGAAFNLYIAMDAALQKARFQSPLHRGATFNELDEFERYMEDYEFQSPLHRGATFNEFKRNSIMQGYQNFSPLFIGEPRSTPEYNSGHEAFHQISVPSSSGSHVQLGQIPCQERKSNLFVSPSSVGNILL